jgi:hypothetical protein
MKRLLTLSACLVLAAAAGGVAQERGTTLKIQPSTQNEVKQPQLPPGTSLGTVTPEMWLYLQEQQRHDDPEMAVRRNAEFRATQRQDRLASRRWFGLSNARPGASPIPTMGTYSPFWSGNDSDPNRWNGTGGPIIIIKDEDGNYIR